MMMSDYPKETSQCASSVLMIRPTAFGRDDEAAQTNSFMQAVDGDAESIAREAQIEFDSVVTALRGVGVDVLVFEDDLGLPDSVFPNNWVSYHQPTEGAVMLITYPMCTVSRRKERRAEVLDAIGVHLRVEPDHLDLGPMENDGEILEGTGSLVLDRVNGVAYACLSGRTTEPALDAWADETGYRVVVFHASGANGDPVYHTNVVMSIGNQVAVVCFDAIKDPGERERVESELIKSGRELLEITMDQMGQFCGNLLELRAVDGNALFAMSATCYEALDVSQRGKLKRFGAVLPIRIPTIERISGGSVRCMIAELGTR
jgi:hypothetical protein